MLEGEYPSLAIESEESFEDCERGVIKGHDDKGLEEESL
jgi:hypothetical protein